MGSYIQFMNDSQTDSDISVFKDFAKVIGTTSFHVKGCLILSRHHSLDQPGIAKIYPNGPDSRVSPSKFVSFLSTKDMITIYRHVIFYQKLILLS